MASPTVLLVSNWSSNELKADIMNYIRSPHPKPIPNKKLIPNHTAPTTLFPHIWYAWWIAVTAASSGAVV